MSELIEEVERQRTAKRLSQAELADILQVTQGHYSKVVSGKVSLTNILAERMQGYLSKAKLPEGDTPESGRVLELLNEIRNKCIEIMQSLNR